MKKYKSKIITIVALLIFLVSTFTPQNVYAAEGIEVNATFGIDGILKDYTSVPATVEVKNNLNEDFKGTVEILAPNKSGTKDSYGQEVEIKKGETKKIILPVNDITQGNKVKIKVSQEDSLLFEKEFVVSSKASTEYGRITIGAFTADKDALKYLNNLSSSNESNFYLSGSDVVELSHELLDSNSKNLQMIDMIVINNFDSTSFTDNEIKSLNAWVNNGGIIIVGGSEKTLNPLNNKLFKSSITSGTDTTVKLQNEEVNLKLGKLSGETGTKILSDGDNILATRIKNGTGSIILTSFDMGDKNFSNISNINETLIKILKEDLVRVSNKSMMGSSYPYELDQVLSTIPLEKEINVSNVMIILGIFIILASFGSYFILKKINKRGYIWVVIPILSIAFTLIIFSIGNETSLNGKIMNSINIVNVDSEGNGKISSYLSIGNKYKSNLKIEEPEGIKIENLVQSTNDMMVGTGNSNSSSEKVSVKTIYSGDKTYYDFNEISALELKKFKIMGQEAKYKKLQSKLNYTDSNLTGTFENPYDTDIEELFIVFGNNLFYVSDIKKGDTYKFNSEKAISQNGINEYQNQMYMNYYMSMNNSRSEELNGSMRNLSILSLISTNSVSSNKPYYIAITKDKIDFGINFGEEKTSEYYQTAYVGDIEVDLKDSEGNIVYPLGYIVPEIDPSDSKTFYIDTNTYSAWDSGESIFQYNLGEKFIVKEITLDVLPNTLGDSSYGLGSKEIGVTTPSEAAFNGSIKIYNFKTEKFDDLSYNSGTPLKLTNLDQYVSGGTLRIKYIGTNEQGGRIPVISAKGRFENNATN